MQLDPVEMQQWVVARSDQVVSRWLSEVTKRLERRPTRLVALLRRFYETFVDMLPEVLGPYRRQVRPMWQEAARLYGEFGAKRGLAAGEVIEEFQVLRGSLIRLLLSDPLMPPDSVPALREVLRLNRFVDQGVSHASIGYTDTLFSTLVSGTGVPESMSDELVVRVDEELSRIRSGFQETVRFPSA
jgi:hypothetical protein